MKTCKHVIYEMDTAYPFSPEIRCLETAEPDSEYCSQHRNGSNTDTGIALLAILLVFVWGLIIASTSAE